MNILLSSYSFCVGRGSEPGVGWNTAISLARRGHNVTVITTPEYTELNRTALAELNLPLQVKEVTFAGLKVFDSSAGYKFWQKNIGAYIREECQRQNYDVIHHITFNQYRGLKDIFDAELPYVAGPLGGAETVAPAFLAYGGMRLKSLLKECLRYLSCDAIPIILRSNRKKQNGIILASSVTTADRLNKGFFKLKRKALVYPAIALADDEIKDTPEAKAEGSIPYFLFYGTPALPEKGIWLMLEAFAQYRKNGGKGKVVIVGLKDPKHQSLVQHYMQNRGISLDTANFFPYIPREEMLRLMRQAAGVIYAGFRDSGGMSALEAVAQGCNLICYDIPSQKWLPETYAVKVPIPSIWQRKKRCAQSLAEALTRAEQMPPRSSSWHAKRVEWLRREMTWKAHALHFEQLYKELLNPQNP